MLFGLGDLVGCLYLCTFIGVITWCCRLVVCLFVVLFYGLGFSCVCWCLGFGWGLGFGWVGCLIAG